MQKFKFSLETVLKIRIRQEEEKKKELVEARNMLALAEKALSDLQQERLGRMQELRDIQTASSVSVEKIKQSYEYISFLDEKIRQQEKVVREKQEKVKVKQGEVVEVMKKRKVLEKLKERDYDRYLKEMSAEEQKFINELATRTYLQNQEKNQ